MGKLNKNCWRLFLQLLTYCAIYSKKNSNEIIDEDSLENIESKYYCRSGKNGNKKPILVVYPKPTSSKRYVKLTVEEFVRLKFIEKLVLELNEKFYQARIQLKKELRRIDKLEEKIKLDRADS